MSNLGPGIRPKVVVLGDPHDPLLEPLALREDASFVIGNTADALATAAETADAILCWWTSPR